MRFGIFGKFLKIPRFLAEIYGNKFDLFYKCLVTLRDLKAEYKLRERLLNKQNKAQLNSYRESCLPSTHF